jgi:putative ABC transport system permease protein
MKSAGRALTAGRERFRLRKILVVSQVALSLVLVAGALLFSRSLRNLLTVDTGFQQSNIAIAGLDLGWLDLPAERRLEFKKDLLGRVLVIPGIESAATTDVIPMSGDSTSNTVWMDGQDSQRVDSLFNRVSPEFFKALQIPLLAGRTFGGRDLAGGAQVVIVNQAFARRLTGGANPVGRRFWRQRTPREPQTLYEIVGLVKDTKYIDLREDFRPIAFLASSQDPRPDLTALVLLRSRLPLAEVRSAVKRAVADVSPAIVIDFDTMPNLIQGSLLRERLMATLSGFFGVLAVLLAGIGLYGVLSYMVARRTNEIGIRMALGADRVRVVNLMMREAAGLLVTGLALGLTLAWIAARAAGSLLYGLKARDPGTLALAAASLAVISMAASYLPSRRAARLDPLVALREE